MAEKPNTHEKTTTAPATETVVRTPLNKIVDMLFDLGEACDPGSNLKGLAHLTRLLALRIIDQGRQIGQRFLGHEQAIKRLQADVAEITHVLVTVDEKLKAAGSAAAPAEDATAEMPPEGEAAQEEPEQIELPPAVAAPENGVPQGPNIVPMSAAEIAAFRRRAAMIEAKP